MFFQKVWEEKLRTIKEQHIVWFAPLQRKAGRREWPKSNSFPRTVWATPCPPKSISRTLTFSKTSSHIFCDVSSNLPLPGCCSGRDYEEWWRMTHRHLVLGKPILNSWSKERPGNHRWRQASCWEPSADNSYLYEPFRKVLHFPLPNRSNLV